MHGDHQLEAPERREHRVGEGRVPVELSRGNRETERDHEQSDTVPRTAMQGNEPCGDPDAGVHDLATTLSRVRLEVVGDPHERLGKGDEHATRRRPARRAGGGSSGSPGKACKRGGREVVLVDEAACTAPVEPRAEVGRLATRREDDEGRGAALGDSLRDLEPVRIRQEDVQQHDLRPERSDRRERRRPVPGLADDLETVCLEQASGKATEARVVVDDQHRLRHARIVSFSTAIGYQGYPESSARGALVRGSHRCESRPTRPSVGGMNNNHLLRIGGAAAVLGVIVQLAAAMLEPVRDGDTDKAIRTIAESGAWTGRWLVHLTGIVLIVVAVAVVTRTFSEGPAKEWARLGQPLFVIAGALGVAEVLVGASTKHLADGWAAAAPDANLSYLAAFEGAWNATVNLDFGALFMLALYLATLAAAILAGNVYARWLGWTSAVAAPLLLVGILLELRSPVGTALGLVGNVLFFVVLIGLGRVDVATSIFACHARRRWPRASRLRRPHEPFCLARRAGEGADQGRRGRRRQPVTSTEIGGDMPKHLVAIAAVFVCGAGTARRARLRTRVRCRRDRMPGRRVELHGSVAARQRRRRQRQTRRP